MLKYIPLQLCCNFISHLCMQTREVQFTSLKAKKNHKMDINNNVGYNFLPWLQCMSKIKDVPNKDAIAISTSKMPFPKNANMLCDSSFPLSSVTIFGCLFWFLFKTNLKRISIRIKKNPQWYIVMKLLKDIVNRIRNLNKKYIAQNKLSR